MFVIAGTFTDLIERTGLVRLQLGTAARRAIGLPSGENIEYSSVWVFRIFLASAFAFTLILNAYGIPIDLAVLYTLGTIMLFLAGCSAGSGPWEASSEAR